MSLLTKTIFIKVNNQLSSNFYLSIFYNYENDITYHTGGLGDWYGIGRDLHIYMCIGMPAPRDPKNIDSKQTPVDKNHHSRYVYMCI